jgi:hypothetical protein
MGNFSERIKQEKLMESMEEKYGTTYEFKVNILFKGYNPTELIGKLISRDGFDKEILEKRVEERLKKEFGNVVRYELISLDRAKEQIFPMM